MDATASTLRYSIGEVSALLHLSPTALRAWERAGLVCPARTPGGHRLYSVEDLDRLRRVAFMRRQERLNAAAILRELGRAEAAQPAADAAPAVSLGARLRALRMEQGLSLGDLAARTGLSVSFLSAVELEQSGISLVNLFKLADALAVTVPSLQEPAHRPPRRLLHPDDRPRYVADAGRVVVEDLIYQAGTLRSQLFQIAPGGESDAPYAHSGEELVYVMLGELEFWIDGGEHYVLRTGDSLHVPSAQPHHWRNSSTANATVLWVNVPAGAGADGRSPG